MCSSDLYVRRDQHEAHDVLLCVGTASNLSDPNRFRIDGEEHYLKSAAEMEALFGGIPGAISNTRLITEMTDLQMPFGKLRLPNFPVPAGHTVESWLRAECERGLVARYGTVTDAIRKRLAELGVEPIGGTPAALGELLASEIQRWGEVIARAGIPKQ